MRNNLHEYPEKVQLAIEHDLHHDISYITDKDNEEDSITDSDESSSLSNRTMSVDSQLNPIYDYFSEDTEDLVVLRRPSLLKGNINLNLNLTPQPQQDMNYEEDRKKLHRQKKHEIHQKVRWYKLLFQVAKILKWWIFMMLCILLLPLSMYSIIQPIWVILLSSFILLSWLIYQIYYDHRFVLLDIQIDFEREQQRISTPHVVNPNKFSIDAITKTLKFYTKEKLHVFIISILLILLFSVMFPFISSDLWVGVYDENEGLMFDSTVVSTYFSRYLDDDLWRVGVCHTFVTISKSPSTEVIMNIHIGGESWIDPVKCNAIIQYWPVEQPDVLFEATASNIPYLAVERKAERLIFSNLLSGLKPDTLYIMQITYYDSSINSRQVSPFKRFRTFPDNPTAAAHFRIIFGGDIGNLPRVSQMHKVASNLNPYAVFIGGDIAYDSGFKQWYCMWDRFLLNWETYMIRAIDGAMIPMASVIGENDFGRNAYGTMAETNIKDHNYYTFMHSLSKLQDESIYRNLYRINGFNITIFSLSQGFEGYFQKNETIKWLQENLSLYSSDFNIAFYHHPLFPACPDRKATFQERDTIYKTTALFSEYNVRIAFEHHEQLYKISYPMVKSTVQIPEDMHQNSTVYLGGGQWGVPDTTCNFDNILAPEYVKVRQKINHFWLFDVVTKQATSYSIDGHVIHTIQF